VSLRGLRLYVKDSISRDLKSSELPYAEAKELLQAWGSWLTNLAPWQWFVTLTFRDPPSNDRGWTKVGWKYAWNAHDEFLSRLQPALGNLYSVSALELQKWRRVPHIHTLVAGLDDLRYSEISKWFWQKYGFIRVLEYDPKMGAGFYLCKYVTKEMGDIRFSESIRNRT
jgi:hypothetical protein